MALVSGQRSTLNPNAPMYVPAIYRQVEDFSPEWWELVKSSTWFRDYWLSVSNVEEEKAEEDDVAEEFEDLLPESFDLDAQFEEMVMLAEAEEKSASDQSSGSTVDETKLLNGFRCNELTLNAHLDMETDPKVDVKTLLKGIVVPRSPKERSPKSPVEPAKYQMKAAQYVSPKCAPRFIHQPR